MAELATSASANAFGTLPLPVHSFLYTDVNMAVEVNDKFKFFFTVGNIFNAHAPLFANNAYTSQPNFLTSWHTPGLIGRTFRAGANFKF